MHAEALVGKGAVDGEELGRVHHVVGEGVEGLEEEGLGAGAVLEGAVEDGFCLGA